MDFFRSCVARAHLSAAALARREGGCEAMAMQPSGLSNSVAWLSRYEALSTTTARFALADAEVKMITWDVFFSNSKGIIPAF